MTKITTGPADASRDAAVLAAAGIPVFPCQADKRPATPHGFKDAVTDPASVQELFRQFPGPLIGVVTGAASGVDVLDLDFRNGADAWWDTNRGDLPETRIHQTQSGGLHLFFGHADGLRNSASKLAVGCDVRADGGYIIWWPAAGCPVMSDAQPSRWPDELLSVLQPPKPPPLRHPLPMTRCERRQGYAVAALRRAIERVATSPQGTRNNALNAECWSLARFIPHQLSEADVVESMAIAAYHADLPTHEASRTIASALRARGAA